MIYVSVCILLQEITICDASLCIEKAADFIE